VISIFWNFFCFHFSLNYLHYFFYFFPSKNCQVKKIQNKKNMLVGGGGDLIQLFNVKISPNYVVFTFTKETK
jgi:hypothetical protein